MTTWNMEHGMLDTNPIALIDLDHVQDLRRGYKEEGPCSEMTKHTKQI